MSDKFFKNGNLADGAERSASVRKKLSLGPLPAQVDQYQINENVELRWDRILLAGALALALVWAVWSMLRPAAEPEPSALMPQLGQQPEEAGSATPIVPDVKEPANDSGQEELLTQAINQLPAPAAIVPNPEPVTAPAQVEAVVPNLLDAVKAALTIQHANVVSGYLHSVGSEFDPGQNGSSLRVALPQQGILKMELHADLTSVQGQTLYHQWLRNGKPQAKITIKPTASVHPSFSSKYINQQMRGDWQARVLDASDKVLAEANFTVY